MLSTSIFFSYVHEDEPFLTELKKHLQPIKRQNLISVWYDNNISPGLDWQQERATQLDTASIILLLISPDFLASDNAYGDEMQRIMQRHKAGEARVIPILLKPADWESAPFAGLTPLPGNTIPITSWSKHEDAFLDVTKGLRVVIDNLQTLPSTQQDRSHSINAPDPDKAKSAGRLGEQTNSRRSIGTTIYRYDVHHRTISVVAWSPNGRHIASSGAGGDGTVRVWDSITGQTFVTYRSHAKSIFPGLCAVWDVKWSPDGQSIASCGASPIVHIWEAYTGKDFVTYDHHRIVGETSAVAWSSDGLQIASAAFGGIPDIDQAIHVWNASTGTTLLKYTGHASGIGPIFFISDIAWSPDGRTIASSGRDKKVKKWKIDPMKIFQTLQIWDPNTGRKIMTCNGYATDIYSLAWSPDAKFIATAEKEAIVRVWDTTSGDNILSYRGHKNDVMAVAWSPDGSRIASAGNDHTVQIWHATTGKLLYVYRDHTDEVMTLAWSPDGTRIASGGSDSIVRIWQAV